jgi:hypothetical protein
MDKSEVEKKKAVKKKFTIFILLLIATAFKVVYGDDWPWPTEKDYFSENKKFVAHITPPQYLKKDKSLFEVFEIKDTQRTPLWQCKMGNERAPVEVYVSDDGKYVVSCNEWGKVGYGDYVVAFYSKDGLIRNYSLEEILHLSKDTNKVDLVNLMPHSITSRRWDENSIKFLDTLAGKLYFCVWLHLFDCWITWNPDNGEEVKVNDRMVAQWNNKARLWSIKEIEKKYHGNTPYEFLGKLRNPNDRSLIEKLLSDEQFSQISASSRTLQPPGADNKPVYHLERYCSSSARRLLAECILENWDGKTPDKRDSFGHPLYYLGAAEGIVKLPNTDNTRDGTLWIYLIPRSINKDKWYEKLPVHRLVVSFSDFSFRNFDIEHTREFPFGIIGVTPGEYWIKAVLGKSRPPSKIPDIIYLPRQDDYQNTDSQIIIVKAGETVENITVDCIHKVADGTY